MLTQEFLDKMTAAVVNGYPQEAESLARLAVGQGLDLNEIIERGCVPGLKRAGQLWEKGEYFLPELVSSAEAMKAAMSVMQPELAKTASPAGARGKIVLGTIEGDIHDIGKNLVTAMLAANGFEVHDLGANVRLQSFIDKALEVGADFIGLSALLTTTMLGQRRFIELLKEKQLDKRFKVVVGGAPVTVRWAEEIGAAGYAENAVSAVVLCRRLMGERT
ncbi:MAG: corrinoid protein [Candidatus Aminicenantales bacterium]